jgi:hypothetical protein
MLEYSVLCSLGASNLNQYKLSPSIATSSKSAYITDLPTILFKHCLAWYTNIMLSTLCAVILTRSNMVYSVAGFRRGVNDILSLWDVTQRRLAVADV